MTPPEITALLDEVATWVAQNPLDAAALTTDQKKYLITVNNRLQRAHQSIKAMPAGAERDDLRWRAQTVVAQLVSVFEKDPHADQPRS